MLGRVRSVDVGTGTVLGCTCTVARIVLVFLFCSYGLVELSPLVFCHNLGGGIRRSTMRTDHVSLFCVSVFSTGWGVTVGCSIVWDFWIFWILFVLYVSKLLS